MGTFSEANFFYEPIFIHGISGLLHLVLLLSVIGTFLYKKLRANDIDSNEGFKGKFLWQKQALACCLVISMINLCLCLVGFFQGFSMDVEFLVSTLNLVLRTLSWGSLFAYLRAYFFTSNAKSFPVLLRVWWGLYLLVSCYSLGVDIVFYYHTHFSFSDVPNIAPDVVSLLNGTFICFVGFTKRVSSMDDDHFLEQSLLGSDSSSTPKVNFFSRFGVRFKHVWKVIQNQRGGCTGEGVLDTNRARGDEKTLMTGNTDSLC